jgi:nucleolar protein 4
LKNLPSNLNKKQLNHKVRKFGNVVELHYPVADEENEDGVVLEGQAVVRYDRFEEAEEAKKKLDGHVFKGAKIVAEDKFERKVRGNGTS